LNPLLRPGWTPGGPFLPAPPQRMLSELLGVRRRTALAGAGRVLEDRATGRRPRGAGHGPMVRGISPGPRRPNGQARIGSSSTSLEEACQ